MRSPTHWSLMNLLICGRNDHWGRDMIPFSCNAMWLYEKFLLAILLPFFYQNVSAYFMYSILRGDTFNIHALCC